MSIQVRAIEPEDREQVVELLVNRWTSPEQLLDGEMVDASRLPGYLALDEGRLVGMITLIKREQEWEILTLDSLQRWGGVGTLLLDASVDAARQEGLGRIMVRTSNDNLDAFRFYQRRGFRLEKVVQGVIDEERKLKPEIPVTGLHGILLRDEVIFGRDITGNRS
ncbi:MULTISPECIES: GNAT family N-acetyltransferase [unclassified Pseudovibrio]|uniref:GNAT family N-acetyltransferase n=1 Tax=unclassified Pseudovibrio TaxID=2627060 RepID=UPI0007AE97C5|nr:MULTISPECIES: GNAT family N-acetyltransferase [unclassified Pseudovibrio]KZL14479.1 Acetyltransferase (GNAT) family protein [Pseudovibrio sp. Ad37]KZL25401.1 Acetyltransferase (GNAT) family protein [Pseudovibrio sp. WM33]